MFSSKHAIWKFADQWDDLDYREFLLVYAETLVSEWSNSANVEFRTTFEILIASFLLEDDLLTASAKAAFARAMRQTIDEAESNKLGIECLHLEKPKPGRRRDDEIMQRFHEVRRMIQEGKRLTEAYEVVARKYSKDSSTVRREYERFWKKQRDMLAGENDQ